MRTSVWTECPGKNRRRGEQKFVTAEDAHTVTPAKAGVQKNAKRLDSGLRRNDVKRLNLRAEELKLMALVPTQNKNQFSAGMCLIIPARERKHDPSIRIY